MSGEPRAIEPVPSRELHPSSPSKPVVIKDHTPLPVGRLETAAREDDGKKMGDIRLRLLGMVGDDKVNGQDEVGDPQAEFVDKADRLAIQKDPSVYVKKYLRIAQLQGRTNVTEETIEAARTNAEAMKPTARIAIRMPTDDFHNMISSDGVYKTVYETGKSKGVPASHPNSEQYLYMRRLSEEQRGIKFNSGEPEVVYGYVDNLLTMASVTPALQYGQVALFLRQDVMSRATFTVGDSMKGIPEAMNGGTAIVAKELNDIAQATGIGNVSYVEAQIFGGISMADVEAVSFTLDSVDADQTGAFITNVKQRYSDTPLTIRVPTARPFDPQIVELAGQYPDVEFVYFIDVQDIEHPGIGMRTTPYKTMMQISNVKRISNEGGQRFQRNSETIYDKAKQRVFSVADGVRDYWQQNHPQVERPANIQVMLTDSKFGINGSVVKV